MLRLHSFTPMIAATTEAVRVMTERYHRRNDATSVSSGFVGVDKLTGGLNGGEVVAVIAEPGNRATALALSVIAHVALQEKRPVVMFTMGTLCAHIVSRLISMTGGVEWKLLENGQLSDSDWPKITATVERLAQAAIFLDESPILSPSRIRARICRIASNQKPRLVVINGLQWLDVPGEDLQIDTDVRFKRTLILGMLKSLAKELGLTVLVTFQPLSLPTSMSDHPLSPQEWQKIGLDQRFVDTMACLIPRQNEEESGHIKPFGLHVHGHHNQPLGTVALELDARYGVFTCPGQKA